MNIKPKVSVIVPVYNTGNKLIPSIESLLNQVLIDLEIIIINDGSTDNTSNVIEQLAIKHSNIVPVHFIENKGVHEARLAGLKKSTAPWIGFMDADDFVRPSMFSTLLATAEENNVDIVVCGADRVTEERKFIASKLRFNRSKKVEDKVFERFCSFEFGTGMLCNKMFKREVIEPWFELHFPWRQSINEDLLMNIGCFYKAKNVYLCKEILYEYVLNKSSVTSTINSSNAYVNTYRAAALAINVFSKLGDEALLRIIDMYRTQLSWNDYQIYKSSDIISHETELREAVDLINNVRPAALAILTARNRLSLMGGKLALKSLIQRGLAATGITSLRGGL